MDEVKKECATGKALTNWLIALNKEFETKKKTGIENPARIAQISLEIGKCVSHNYRKYLFKMSYAELRNQAYKQFAKNPVVRFLLHTDNNVANTSANAEQGGTQRNNEQRNIIGTNGEREFYAYTVEQRSFRHSQLGQAGLHRHMAFLLLFQPLSRSLNFFKISTKWALSSG
jgi:hypothetical protein